MKDYFIIGQGLAGSVMAMRLIKNGKSVMVFNKEQKHLSSRVAAGIFNPITGKRFSLSWKAHECFRELFDFYRWVEDITKSSFFHPMPIHRIVPNPGSSNDWLAKSRESPISDFVVGETKDLAPYKAPWGAIELKQSGYVDTNSFLDATQRYLQSIDSFEIRDDFAHAVWNGTYFCIDEFRASKIIYCNGLYAHSLVEFDNLPFSPMKGQVLELESNSLPNDKIITAASFLCPTGHNTFNLGSTYEWRTIDLEITEEARIDLTQRYHKYATADYSIKNHRVGIRPAVKDRMPLLGRDPNGTPAYLFNGLGSKGVSMAPYLSRLLFDHIENEAQLPVEVSINRFNA